MSSTVLSSSVLSVSFFSPGVGSGTNVPLRLGLLFHNWPCIWGLGGNSLLCDLSFLLFSSFSSGAGTKGSMRGEFGLVFNGLGKHSLHNGAFSSS